MTEQIGDHLQEKLARSWKFDVDTRNRWIFGAFTLASFLMLQTLLSVALQDIALTVSLLAFAVGLPMNILLLLLTYAKKGLNENVSRFIGATGVVCTFIGIDAAFWHASSVVGVVFTVSAMIAFSYIVYLTYSQEPKANEKG